jgi:hypothetical protein
LNQKAGECPQSDWLYSLFAILRTDLKGNTPLLKENSIRSGQTISWIVDMRGLGGHSIQLDDLEVLALFEIGQRGRPNIKASEKEPIEPTCQAIDRGLHRLSLDLGAIEENTPATMCADFNQLY